MSLFGSWFASRLPDAAIEITADRVSGAVVGYRDGRPIVTAHASEPLAPGIVVPSFTAPNVVDKTAALAAVRQLMERLPVRPRRLALVLPDSAAKVSLVRFDQVPSRRDDLEQLVRWQVRKALPFPIEDATITFTPGLAVGESGREYLAVAARRSIVSEYEHLCEEAGGQPGIVDLATLSLLNMFLTAQSTPPGDWLLVHVRADSTSIVIMRGADVVFYRNRAEGEQDTLGELVHQTTMYYQDRLSGGGFSQVLVAGVGRHASAVEAVRRSVEEHLGLAVEPVEPTKIAALTDRITVSADLMDVLGPLVGISMRTGAGAAA